MERRLAAILAADVVGYTRLMGVDEAGTLRRLTALRLQTIEPIIARHNGRIVKLMGDGMLVEFASVVDALACAIAWQAGLSGKEGGDEQLAFRIGINIGDVIVEGDDIHGDGVNIAARIEALAEPGGVCLSDDAYRQVRGRLDDIAFDDLGEQELKNVAEPVRVHRVRPGHCGAATPVTRTTSSGSPVRPSVAVLPFKELSRDSAMADFCDGLAADIITELSRSGTISVVGYHESQSRDLVGKTLQEIGRILSVRYVLSGTIRFASDRVRITSELLEVRTGSPSWMERFDRSLSDPFAVQDEIALVIVGVVEPKLHRAEMDRISQSPAKELQPHELMLRAWRTSDKGYEEGNHEAKRDCLAAIELNPEYSDAYSQLAWILWYEALNGWTDDPESTLQCALENAETGWSLNPKDYDALGARGTCLVSLGRYEAAARILEELANKFPGHAHATMYQCEILLGLGEPQKANELVERSVAINPQHDQWHWMNMGFSLFCLERFDEAIDAFEQFRTVSKFPFIRLMLAAAYAAEGRDKEAGSEISSLDADFEKLAAGARFIFGDAADCERLRKWANRAAASA